MIVILAIFKVHECTIWISATFYKLCAQTPFYKLSRHMLLTEQGFILETGFNFNAQNLKKDALHFTPLVVQEKTAAIFQKTFINIPQYESF